MTTRTSQRKLRDGRVRGAHFYLMVQAPKPLLNSNPHFRGDLPDRVGDPPQHQRNSLTPASVSRVKDCTEQDDALVVGLATTTICIHALRPGTR